MNFKKTKSTTTSKGFSLVELLVVVAIIGILATIGIPRYQKFKAKARQSEAKVYLNAIFQAQESFSSEHDQYTINLRVLGVSAVGRNLRYNAGFDIDNCANYTAPAPAGNNANNDLIAIDAADFTPTTWAAVINDFAGGEITKCESAAGVKEYWAGAWGNPTDTFGGPPNNADNNLDQFTINNRKELRHVSIGM